MVPRRLARAFHDTSWFSWRADIAPPIVGAVATTVAIIAVQRDETGFEMQDVVIPALVGVAAVGLYWAVINSLEFM
jgi:hypothetical protein